MVGGSPPPGNIEPIIDYGRSTGGTVIGGYLYRGSQVPALWGKYVFGDYLSEDIFSRLRWHDCFQLYRHYATPFSDAAGRFH